MGELTQVSSPVGAHIFLPNNLSHHSPVLDLAFASPPLLPLVSEAHILDSTGSGHLPVLLRIASPNTIKHFEWFESNN